MTIDEFYQSGYVGIYNAKTNTIKIIVTISNVKFIVLFFNKFILKTEAQYFIDK